MFNLDPHGTVSYKGVNVPVLLCHQDSYQLGLGGNHADIYHWFPKHGKSMATAREDVAKLLANSASQITPIEPEKPAAPAEPAEMYRVRKSWEDAKSQVGAYSKLENAKNACDKAGEGYEVYNSKGVAVYPESVVVPEEDEPVEVKTFKVGDEVRLTNGAKYTSGKAIPAWVFERKLYVREARSNGTAVISTVKTGAVTGVVSMEFLVKYDGKTANTDGFNPYLVKINTDVLNVRQGAGTGYKITTQVRKNQVYTIVEEKSGWGKLKSGAGWISLTYTKKL